MKAIVQTFRTLIGLFFDDGSLALAIITLLVSVALLAQAGGLASPFIMVLLVIGTLVLLLENVIRSTRRHSR